MTNTIYRQQPAPVFEPPNEATNLLLHVLDNERRTLRTRLAFIDEVQAQSKVGHHPTLLTTIDQERRVLCRRVAFADTVLGNTTSDRESLLQSQIDDLKRELVRLRRLVDKP